MQGIDPRGVFPFRSPAGSARRALDDDRWPALVVEDDVTFAPLLEQPGGGTALADALAAATAGLAALGTAETLDQAVQTLRAEGRLPRRGSLLDITA